MPLLTESKARYIALSVLCSLIVVSCSTPRNGSDAHAVALAEQQRATAELRNLREETRQLDAERKRLEEAERARVARDAARQLAASELRDIEVNRDNLARRVSEHETAIAAFDRYIAQRRTALDDYRGEVKKYMMDHKMALAAIAATAGGASVALTKDNSFSDDAKVVGALAGLVGFLYAVNNASEIATVVDQLNQADSHVREIEAQISKAQQTREHEVTSLGPMRSELASSESAVETARHKLASFSEGLANVTPSVAPGVVHE